MDDDERQRQYANLPIPTYEEATSRPSSSSNNYHGPSQSSDDAERQGLLGQPGANPRGRRPEGYRAPTVESARSSLDSRSDADSDLSVPEMVEEGQDARRRVEEFDFLEPGESEEGSRRQARLYHRARIRNKFTQHLTSLGATLSAIRMPSLRSLYTPVAAADGGDAPAPQPGSWRERVRGSVRVPEQLMLSGPTFAKLCGLFTIGALVWVLFALEVFPNTMGRMGIHFDPESVRSYVQEHIDAEAIQGYLYHITSFDHVAGTEGDLYLASWMKERWLEQGDFDDVALLEYYVYLNYPNKDGRSVEIVSPEVRKWKAMLEEEPAYADRQQSLAWHGHSKSGEAEGPLVYANGGSREDFAFLRDHGVQLNGTIALVRYYSTQGDRALKIKAAEEAGCVGVLIYSDPADDGAAKGAVWPEGPWRPADSLQRGGVSLMSWVVGDPLTPGWASTMGSPRLPKEDNPGLVNIPSLPLAWRDAEILIKSLQDTGPKAPESWIGGSPGFTKDWHTGDGAKSPVVRLRNLNDENSLQQIWNLHGLIQGIESPETKILIGNHRDSWCFGSVDPGSGSAIMMELVNIFGALRKLGWRPLRTIEFASWDAEEYNLVGSTEYVEDNVEYLRGNALAYLNVDVGVAGPNFRAAASPLWERPLLHVLDRIADPHSNATLRQIWNDKNSALEGLGAGSDYVAFQDIAGTSSIDFGFEGEPNSFPYHSCYETFEWMQKFGDPTVGESGPLPYHKALAQVWALLILELADKPLVPFDLQAYASAIRHYAEQLAKDAKADQESAGKLNFTPLFEATASLKASADQFHTFENEWTTNVLARTGGLETQRYLLKRLEYNHRILRFETDLLDLPNENPVPEPKDAGKGKGKKKHRKGGVPGREQFKHIVFGPQAWSGYDEAYFPAVRDLMAARDWEKAQEYLDIAAERIRWAGERLIE
jgi:hypothetical protein